MDMVDADIVKCVVSCGFGEIASIAAQTRVDQEVIATIAHAHGDASFADTVRSGVEAYTSLITVALDALYALQPHYTNKGILDAVRVAQERPTINPGETVIQLDADRYRTKNARLLLDIWTVLNCGRYVSDVFFAELKKSQADLEEPGDFLDLFNSCITEKCLRDGCADLKRCMGRVAVAVATLGARTHDDAGKHSVKRKRTGPQQGCCSNNKV
jgi:hypothetical protein